MEDARLKVATEENSEQLDRGKTRENNRKKTRGKKGRREREREGHAKRETAFLIIWNLLGDVKKVGAGNKVVSPRTRGHIIRYVIQQLLRNKIRDING